MSAPLTHRTVLAIAVPITLSNATVPLVGAVDTAVVGQLGAPELIGGVGVGTVVATYIIWLFAFIRAGTAGLTARAKGRGDADEQRAALGRSVLIGFGLGTVLMLAGPLIWQLAEALFQASAEVEAHAETYILTRLWGAPALLANFALLGWFMGRQRTSRVLILQLFLNGVNIALDLVFVLHWGWGVKGVAAASAIAEWATFLPALALAARDLKAMGGRWQPDRLFAGDAIRETVLTNRDLFIRTLFLATAFALVSAESAKLGDLELAATTILLNLLTIAAYGMDGFAIAAEALTGEAIGARTQARFHRAVRLTSLWAVATAVFFAALWWLAGPTIIAAMSTSEAVQTTALAFLPWLIIQPLVAACCFQLDGFYIGMGATKAMRNWMVVSFAIYLASLMLTVPVWGGHGIWFTFNLFFVARAATQLYAWRGAVRGAFA